MEQEESNCAASFGVTQLNFHQQLSTIIYQ